ncbi:helix-turn-helix domain-containing protein [Kineococcus glutinatus]|uniref:Helix-turn-helix domain-containing protein n=1 Tax=Kineococcus glutinatus TaxID=1070872 RepID=A0ABP9H2T9_9ACTN
MTTTSAPEAFVAGEQAADLLGKDVRWLRNNAERLAIPRYKIGNQYRYRLSEVAAWLEGQAVR